MILSAVFSRSSRLTLDRIFLILWVVFTALLIFHRTELWSERGYGDSAFLAEVLLNLHSKGTAETIAGRSAVHYVYSGFVSTTAENLHLLNTTVPNESSSVFKAHAYFILAPISVFLNIFNVQFLLSLCFVISFTGALLILYRLIRGSGVSPMWSFAFCITVACHPAWREPLWLGQDYVDRYYIGLGTLTLASVYGFLQPNSARKFGLCAISALLCFLISERFALMMGGSLVFLALPAFFSDRRKGLLLCGLGLLGITYAFVIMSYLLDTHSYSSFLSLQSFLHPIFFSNQESGRKTILMLVLVLPLLLLSLRNITWGLLAAGTMIPNIFGNIGGGEKTGWIAHYPTIYVPVLFFAAALGFAKIPNQLKGAAIGVLALLFVCLDPYKHQELSPADVPLSQRVPALWAFDIVHNLSSGQYAQARERQRRYETAMPRGVKVSSPEFAMAKLVFGRRVYLFPTGIEDADYAVMSKSPTDPNLFAGFFSIQPPDEQEKINREVMKMLTDLHYDFGGAQEIVPGIYAIRRGQP